MALVSLIKKEIAELEPQWQREYQRLGNEYAIIAAWLITLTYPLGILADVQFIKDDKLPIFLGIQLFPSLMIGIAAIIRRFFFFRHEILVLIMAFSIFTSATHRVEGQDLVYYLINNGLCFVGAASLMIVKPIYPLIIFIYVITTNILVHSLFYKQGLAFFFLRDGGIVLMVGGIVFFLVTRFRYFILKNNFINTLALQRSYDLLGQKNKLIEEKSEIIRLASEDIKASITYASRIQKAILPFESNIYKVLPEHFILYKSRDLVSGDFYWFEQIKVDNEFGDSTKLVFAAIDCTGHGVPGAFMSMLGSEALNNIVIQNKILEPDRILHDLHLEIRALLKQEETHNQDGMDMALCVIDLHKKILEFAGAKNPLVYIQNGTLHTIKGDKLPIGGFHFETDAHRKGKFTKHSLDISQPGTYYIFTDGYQDQFGGDKGKKFMVGNFRELLFQIHQKPMNEQKQILEKTLLEWKHGYEQVDDILVIGFKL